MRSHLPKEFRTGQETVVRLHRRGRIVYIAPWLAWLLAIIVAVMLADGQQTQQISQVATKVLSITTTTSPKSRPSTIAPTTTTTVQTDIGQATESIPEDINAWLVLGFIALSAAWLVGFYWSWVRYFIAETANGLILRQGIIRRVGLSIPWDKVNDVNADDVSGLHRIAGVGTLHVDTAGRQLNISFTLMRKPQRARQTLMNARDAWVEANKAKETEPIQRVSEQLAGIHQLLDTALNREPAAIPNTGSPPLATSAQTATDYEPPLDDRIDPPAPPPPPPPRPLRPL